MVEDRNARDEFDGRRPIIGICHGMEFMSDVPTLSIRDGILDIGTTGWHRGSLNMQSRIRRCVCLIHPLPRSSSTYGDFEIERRLYFLVELFEFLKFVFLESLKFYCCCWKHS